MRLRRLWHRSAAPAAEPRPEKSDDAIRGAAEALGLGGVLYDPDRDDDSKYEDRTDGELHWAETNDDDDTSMP